MSKEQGGRRLGIILTIVMMAILMGAEGVFRHLAGHRFVDNHTRVHHEPAGDDLLVDQQHLVEHLVEHRRIVAYEHVVPGEQFLLYHPGAPHHGARADFRRCRLDPGRPGLACERRQCGRRERSRHRLVARAQRWVAGSRRGR